MSRRETAAVITLSEPGEFNTGPWLLGALCILDAFLHVLRAIELPLMWKAGFRIDGCSASRDVACLVAIDMVTSMFLIRAGVWMMKGLKADGAIAALIAALFVSLLLPLYVLSVDSTTPVVLLLGHGRRVNGSTGLMGLMLLSAGWNMLVMLVPLLVARIRRTDPSWALVAFCWLLGGVLDSLLKRRLWPWSVMALQERLWAIPPLAISLLILVVIFRSRRRAIFLLCALFLVRVALVGWATFETIRPGPWVRATWLTQAFIYLQAFVFLPLTELVPLVLVVWAGRFANKIGLKDDGSPWPRRYCAKCFYNLHGVEADRCPECGNELVTPALSGHVS